MNYWRIIGIGGAAFCTAALAAAGAGAALNTPENWKFAILTAFLQGGLATFQEIQKESVDVPPIKGALLANVMLL